MNIACPLCGRHVPENVFDPSDFDQDIYAVDVTGLGRGKGFSASEPYSILEDRHITGLIAHSAHEEPRNCNVLSHEWSPDLAL